MPLSAFLLVPVLTSLWQLAYFRSLWPLQSPASPSDVTGMLYSWAQTKRIIRTLLDSYKRAYSHFWTGTQYLDTGPNLKTLSQNSHF